MRRDAPNAAGSGIDGGIFVSIVRVGLAETKKFAEGYDAIFGNKGIRSGKPKKKSRAPVKNRTSRKKTAKRK